MSTPLRETRTGTPADEAAGWPNRILVAGTAEAPEITLTGEWSLRGRVPRYDAVAAHLAQARRVRVSAHELTAWDTSAVTFLAALVRDCNERRIPLDQAALPDGLRRLLALAFAVPPAVPRAAATRPGLLATLGQATLSIGRDLSRMSEFAGEIILSLARFTRGRARYRREELAWLVEEAGPRALPIVSLISFLVGTILAYMGAVQLALFGAEIYIADLVGIGVVREVAALMTGIILAGRTGAAYAAQLGTMQVNEEIDAFRTLGVSPIDYLVLPRMLALVAMVPLLTLYAGIVGILAGMLIAVGVFDVGAHEYYNETLTALELKHFAVGLVKGTVYGALVAYAGCLRGMQCGRSAQAVGEATTSAVVLGILLITISASVLTIVFHKLGI
ncbi:MAG: ABC transporter permease [Gammaproteobacteria bacterium]|nr:ABC transporter permease [Gammaproteobacteria bacterium]